MKTDTKYRIPFLMPKHSNQCLTQWTSSVQEQF